MSMPYIFINRDKNSSIFTQVAKILLKRGTWKCGNKNSLIFNLMLGDRNNLPFNRLGEQPGQTQLVNYYRGSSELCKKVSSYRLLRDYREQFGLEQYDFIPESYIIVPASMSASSHVQDDRMTLLSKHDITDSSTDIWISKVSSGGKGVGILMSRDVKHLLAAIDSQRQSHIIQRYIPNPFLLPGCRKFDMRVWAILDVQYKIYMYKEGVVRTCSDEYDLGDITKVASHLTNHCLQEQLSDHFGKYEPNNEIFFSQFERLLQRTADGNCSLHSDVIPQMDRIICECFDAIHSKISAEGLTYQSFQLFGFDFLLDETFKVWLLEVNGAPATSSDLLKDMAEAIVQLCIDFTFPEGTDSLSDRKYLFRLIKSGNSG